MKRSGLYGHSSGVIHSVQKNRTVRKVFVGSLSSSEKMAVLIDDEPPPLTKHGKGMLQLVACGFVPVGVQTEKGNSFRSLGWNRLLHHSRDIMKFPFRIVGGSHKERIALAACAPHRSMRSEPIRSGALPKSVVLHHQGGLRVLLAARPIRRKVPRMIARRPQREHRGTKRRERPELRWCAVVRLLIDVRR